MKKSLKVALAAVCLIAAGAFFMGCANPSGGETGTGTGNGTSSGGTGGSGTGSGSSGGGVTYIGKKAPGTVLAVGDIVFNDGSATPYSVIGARAEKECTDAEKAAAIAVIFRVGDGTEGNKTLGVGIKHETGLEWCISDAAGYQIKFTETVCKNDEGTRAPDLTFKNSPNTDGSKNLGKMVLQMDEDNDTKISALYSGKVLLIDKKLSSVSYYNFKKKYPAFEFAYYYGLNLGHNITPGSDFENGWYLPSVSELNDIYQANKTDSVIENALGVTGGNKFDGSEYWSSSQYHSDENTVDTFWFERGCASGNAKNGTKSYVCAVRAFN